MHDNKSYKFSRFDGEELKKYEFNSREEVELWINQELDKFKINNKVKNEYTDRYFILFKSELENILNR